MENRIINCLKESKFKPGYIWKAQNYLNGFLVNIPNYSAKTMDEFQLIMSHYCEKGYFLSENGIAGLPNYRLTDLGYKE